MNELVRHYKPARYTEGSKTFWIAVCFFTCNFTANGEYIFAVFCAVKPFKFYSVAGLEFPAVYLFHSVIL